MSSQVNRKNIIISADDFGKSKLANRNILFLAQTGKLDRVSVMADGSFNDEEISQIKKTGVKLDIHLELAWQKKRRDKIKDNTARQGIIFLVNHFGSSRRKKVGEDWVNQVKKFQKIFGQYPDGINSHEYVHLFPAYFKIALGLGKKFDISYIRFAKRDLLGGKNMARTILNNLRRWNKRNFSASGLESSDYFVSFDWMKNLGEHLKNFPEGKTEIACHPERTEEFIAISKYF
jgi:chitin disaccharide deacetylase